MAKDSVPDWSERVRTLYLSGAANQFVLSGNVNDRFLWGGGDGVVVSRGRDE